MSIRVQRIEAVLQVKEMLTTPIIMEDDKTVTNKEFFSDIQSLFHLIADNTKGIDLHIAENNCCQSTTKIEVMCTLFEGATLEYLKNAEAVLLAPERGFTKKDFGPAETTFWLTLYAQGVFLKEVEKTLQNAGIDTTGLDEQQMVDKISECRLGQIYNMGAISDRKFHKGQNVLSFPHAEVLLQNILKPPEQNPLDGTMTSLQHAQMRNWDLYEQMKFMSYLASVKELSSDSLQGIQATIWHKYHDLEQERSQKALEQLLAEDVEEKKQREPPSKKTTPHRRTAAPVKQEKQQKSTSESSKEPEKKKSPQINPAYQQLLQTLNTTFIKSRLPCDPRVLRWRDVPLEKIRDTFIDRKGGKLIKQYASSTDEELKYQQQMHNIPMERIVSISNIQDKYSYPYKFTVNGAQKVGRCFYAQMVINKVIEPGIIRVGMDHQTREIYHIKFEKRNNVSFDQLTLNIDTAEIEEEAGTPWEQNTKYMFNMEGDKIVVNIQNMKSREIVTYKISPLI